MKVSARALHMVDPVTGRRGELVVPRRYLVTVHLIGTQYRRDVVHQIEVTDPLPFEE